MPGIFWFTFGVSAVGVVGEEWVSVGVEGTGVVDLMEPWVDAVEDAVPAGGRGTSSWERVMEEERCGSGVSD